MPDLSITPLPTAAPYVERIEFRDLEVPMGTVLSAYRHGTGGHLWLEMTGDAPEAGCDALLGLALNREQARQLAAMIGKMLGEGAA